MNGIEAKDDEADTNIGGRPIPYWLDLFFHTHHLSDNVRRYEWPDGGTYFSQDNVLIEVFDIARDEIMIRILEETNKRK